MNKPSQLLGESRCLLALAVHSQRQCIPARCRSLPNVQDQPLRATRFLSRRQPVAARTMEFGNCFDIPGVYWGRVRRPDPGYPASTRFAIWPQRQPGLRDRTPASELTRTAEHFSKFFAETWSMGGSITTLSRRSPLTSESITSRPGNDDSRRIARQRFG
jgi:hypothetical protein